MPRFATGEIVEHLRFAYRGVIFGVDPTFAGSDEWYEVVARSRPPKDAPWYHVLVDGAEHTTYAAQENLASDDSGEPIVHPLIDLFFDGLEDGAYGRNDRPWAI